MRGVTLKTGVSGIWWPMGRPTLPALCKNWLRLPAPSRGDQHRFITARMSMEAQCSTGTLLWKWAEARVLLPWNYLLVISLSAGPLEEITNGRVFSESEWTGMRPIGFRWTPINPTLKKENVPYKLAHGLSEARISCFDSCILWVYLLRRTTLATFSCNTAHAGSHGPGSIWAACSHLARSYAQLSSRTSSTA